MSRENNLRLKDIKLNHFGSAKTFECSKSFTTIVGGTGNMKEVEEKIEVLKTELDQTEDLHECGRIQERITRLASGIAIIKVGGATEIEMTEKRHRIEDALEAVKSAQQEGIIPGGGIALIKACNNLQVKTENENQELGVKIILEAVKEPARQMAINAGESPDIILSMIEKEANDVGVDFTTGKTINMLDAGIIDPAKVTRCALQNAASVASTLITTNSAVIEV